MNWLYVIIVGGIAGWLASSFMKGKGMGIVWNVILGIIGAFVGGFALSFFGLYTDHSLIGFLVQSVVGAIIVLGIARALTK